MANFTITIARSFVSGTAANDTFNINASECTAWAWMETTPSWLERRREVHAAWNCVTALPREPAECRHAPSCRAAGR